MTAVALDVYQTAVALVLGTLQPPEREIDLAAEGMRFGDLIGRVAGVLALQGR